MTNVSTQEPRPSRAGSSGADLLEQARTVVRMEARALSALEERLDETFLEAVDVIADASGRVIASGIGKSGIIARKLAATLTSTGTPATFLHPVEGLHGDLGIVGREDAAILISKSGESEELSGLLSHLRRLGVPIVALAGRSDSSLAHAATVVLDCSVAEEACPFDLAPTTSSTTALAMCDALAVALLVRKGFSREDFARLHPGGAIGRKLTLQVRDVMITDDVPVLSDGGDMRECVALLAEKRGTVAVLDEERRVRGVITAGDLTRLMERRDDFLSVSPEQLMTCQPRLTSPDALAAAAVHDMETHGVMALPAVDDDGVLVGMVHLHDLLKAGAA